MTYAPQSCDHETTQKAERLEKNVVGRKVDAQVLVDAGTQSGFFFKPTATIFLTGQQSIILLGLVRT